MSPPGGISHSQLRRVPDFYPMLGRNPCYPFPGSFATLSAGIDYAESLKIIVLQILHYIIINDIMLIQNI